ncbi:MAG: TRAP transporter fused permease subunit [Bacteroidales bacterium]
MQENPPEEVQVKKHRTLNKISKWYFIIVTAIGVYAALSYNFYISFFGFDFDLVSYIYFLVLIFLPPVYLLFPFHKNLIDRPVPWYDYAIAFLLLISASFMVYNSESIVSRGWEIRSPLSAQIFSLILVIGTIEAARRAVNLAFTILVVFFALLPLYAGSMPSFLSGTQFGFWRTISYHGMGPESIMGIPLRVVGSILIGYLVFAVVLRSAGAGEFFLRFAFALLGGVRGGAAKVAVIASGFFGSISGSVISNVLTTGTFTIPAMKKTGYPSHYAGAVETVASTGGVLTPPIMGVTAFIMAQFLGKPYASVALAAAIPAFLFYLALLVHVDGMAAKLGLQGIAKSDRPRVREVLKEGWFYFLVLLLLLYYIFVLYKELQAPWVSIVLLLVITQIKKSTRFNFKNLTDMIQDTGKVLAELVAILAAVGLIIGSMSLTGVGHAMAREIVALAGGNVALLLLLGALASLILGMGMTISACYIFLAIVLAPALVRAGFEPMAVHLYVLYWGMLSFITPPVALGAFAASSVAGSAPMKTGFTAAKLGFVIYLLPVFFVLNPALILIGSPMKILLAIPTAIVGIWILASSMEGYLIILGKLSWWNRIILGLSGAVLAFPDLTTDIIGFSAIAAVILITIVYNKSILKNKAGKNAAVQSK